MASIKTYIFVAWIGFGLGTLVYAVLATEYNRILIFKEPIPDKVLPGHVIRTEVVADEGSCRVQCYLEPNCVSINVGPADRGKRSCELKNFTDESPSHSALKKKEQYIHYAVENFCYGSRCPGQNTLCQVGFTDKGYRCVCREGYKGDQCNEDVNECELGLHDCKAGFKCENVAGSFQCKCWPGFVLDGINCKDVDECAKNTDNCHSDAICTNTDGHFQCECKSGFMGNGVNCIPCVVGTGTLSGSSYGRVGQPKTWNNAEADCKTLGGHLVNIDSLTENDFIKNTFLTSYGVIYWIGSTRDQANVGTWIWTAGGNTNGYSNWASRQPDNYDGNQNCAIIAMITGRVYLPFYPHYILYYHNAQWNDMECHFSFAYICEKAL